MYLAGVSGVLVADGHLHLLHHSRGRALQAVEGRPLVRLRPLVPVERATAGVHVAQQAGPGHEGALQK